MVELIKQNFLNEERFAQVFAGGKFRIRKWGRLKIKRALEIREVSDYCIRKGMKEIKKVDYEKTLKKLLKDKLASLKVDDTYVKRSRAAKFMINKGYEPEMVWRALQ
ncbi:MAG: RecX family transcriptional regulator [Bacteroidetes bacterium]|nr:RecX family transcriptional regulator [Bacteroidota bacterium]